MSRYHYWSGKDAHRFCVNDSPSFRCPVGGLPHPDPDGGSAAWPIWLEDRASELGVRADWLAARLRHGPGRMRVDGKLTNHCRCGARLERLGFLCWEERDPAGDELDSSTQQIAQRLTGRPNAVTLWSGYKPTKREAHAWARTRASE